MKKDLGRAVPRVYRRKECKQHEAMRSKTKQTNKQFISACIQVS